MDGNTGAQRRLYPELVCDEFEEIIELGQTYDALGCMVNCAGGDGGSMTLVSDGIIGCGRMAGTIDDEVDYPHPNFIPPCDGNPGLDGQLNTLALRAHARVLRRAYTFRPSSNRCSTSSRCSS